MPPRHRGPQRCRERCRISVALCQIFLSLCDHFLSEPCGHFLCVSSATSYRRISAVPISVLIFGAALLAATAAQTPTPMTTRATGTFDVKLNPLDAYDKADDSPMRRMSIDKQFHGDLEATSRGEMLSAGTAVKTSAGYVAIERVSGSLNGRKGTFVLQHNGIMNRGTPQLTVTVVPDSGTGELVGLFGKMTIIIEGGKHSYELEYSIETPK